MVILHNKVCFGWNCQEKENTPKVYLLLTNKIVYIPRYIAAFKYLIISIDLEMKVNHRVPHSEHSIEPSILSWWQI